MVRNNSSGQEALNSARSNYLERLKSTRCAGCATLALCQKTVEYEQVKLDEHVAQSTTGKNTFELESARRSLATSYDFMGQLATYCTDNYFGSLAARGRCRTPTVLQEAILADTMDFSDPRYVQTPMPK